jgi:Tfp pilus assembly pilus retraction ATPase PilT
LTQDQDSGNELSRLIQLHRDWRIDTSSPDKSVVFMSGQSAGAQLSPVSGQSKAGREFLPVFYALAQSIESYRRRHMMQLGRVDAASDPRTFAVLVQGVRCRVQMVQEGRYHVRVPSELLQFSRLRMPEGLQTKLLSHELDTGGLVVVCGGYGSGKTSTVNAVVRERIDCRGGYALVMGNPIEYEYAGFHGSTAKPGYIEQVDLVGLDLDAEIKASMRNFPAGAVSILAYPELIGSSGVGEMLRAANRGNLVFADMHALNIEASIINLVSMGEQDNESYTRELLGNSLRLVIHQKMAAMPNSDRGVSVAYSYIAINRSMRAAIVDRSMPLSKAITSVLSLPGSA